MNSIIEQIYRTKKVIDKNGIARDLDSAVDAGDGEFLYKIIRDNAEITKTLEIGCANGLSSLHIAEALKGRGGAAHTIIDPFQNSYWDGIGVANLMRSGVDFFKLIEEKSEFALPKLCQEREECFDFVFVDGFHTFDHTLIDCFYATRLLRPGGYLVVDDVSWRSVARCMRYFKNYPCFNTHDVRTKQKPKTMKRLVVRCFRWLMPKSVAERIFCQSLVEKIWNDDTTLMIALKKVSRDERDWKWYVDF